MLLRAHHSVVTDVQPGAEKVPSPDTGSISLRILGPLDVRDASHREIRSVLSQPKRLALISYLALSGRGGFCHRDSVVALFWPEFDQVRARGALRQALSWLRRELGKDILTNRGEEEVGVAADLLRTDAVEFDEALAADDPERALSLYRGDLLDGVFVANASPDFERWLEDERARLRRDANRSALGLVDREVAAGRLSSAVSWARRATALSPNDEASHRRLIELLQSAGDRAGAVEAYTGFRERLLGDFGVEPSERTQRLIAEPLPSITDDASPVQASIAPELDSLGREASVPQRRARRFRSAGILAAVTVIIVAIATPPLRQTWLHPSATPASLASAAGILPNRPPGSEARPTTSNPEAYRLLLRAAYILGKRGAPDFVNARTLIQQALDLDPLYADAYSMLSTCLEGYAWYGLIPANEAFPRAEAAARHAVALDSLNGLGHAMIAATLSFYHYRWEEAESLFRRAIELDPENANSYNFYAIHLRTLGKFDEALGAARKAQSLDRLYRHYYWAAGYILVLAGQDSEAIIEFRRAVELDSTYTRPRFDIVEALARQGRFDSALRELSVALNAAGENEAAAVADTAKGELGYRDAVRWMGAARLKRLRDAQAQGKYVAAWQLADAMLDAGYREAAIGEIQRAFEVRDPRLTYLNSPRYRGIIADSRVRAVLRKMNLEGRG